MRISALILLAIFSFQTLDVPPARTVTNPKTCCGRAVCLCKHEKGAPCSFKHKLAEAVSSHKTCHLPKIKTAPSNGIVFTNAPCATDTPKTLSPKYSKDFLLPIFSDDAELLQEGMVPIFPRNIPDFFRVCGIERPPRII